MFSAYLFVLGAVLVLAPNFLLSLFGFPVTSEVWIRVVGVLVLAIGFYYYQAAKHELEPIFRATVTVRFGVLVAFILFVAFGLTKPILILFGAVDAAAAVWTAVSLRSDSAGWGG